MIRFSSLGASTLLVAALCAGCSYSYPYELSGVIKDVADGKPLAGVKIFMAVFSIRDGQDPLVQKAVDLGIPPVVTRADGSFTQTEQIGDFEFVGQQMPTRTLILIREGYETEVIDISPKQKPDSTRTPTQILVKAYMRTKHQGQANLPGGPK